MPITKEHDFIAVELSRLLNKKGFNAVHTLECIIAAVAIENNIDLINQDVHL